VAFFAGQELSAATLERIANPPRARVVGNAVQTIPNNAFTALRFPEQVYLSQIGHDPVTNPTFFSAQIAGLYELNGGAYTAASTVGIRAMKWQKNGVDIPGSGSSQLPVTGGGQTGIIARPIEVELAVTDFVTLLLFQSSGGNLDTYIAVDYAKPSMSIKLIRDNSL
jgi:hypothetical protein